MTYEEAIKKISWTPLMRLENEHGELKEALTMAINALEKADKYRWHDLRKDPNDLPEPWEYVLVNTSKDGDYIAQIDSIFHAWVLKDDVFSCCEVGSYMVKAWREIEPFEVEE